MSVKKEKVHIMLSTDEIFYHQIFRDSFYSTPWEFDIEKVQFLALEELMKANGIDLKYLNCLASKLCVLSKSQNKSSGNKSKREVRKIEWQKVNDEEIKNMSRLIQLMRGRSPLEKITFYFAGKNITINAKGWLYQITTAINKRADQIESSIDIAKNPPQKGKMKSRLVSEELNEFFVDCGIDSNQIRKFILEFYELAGYSLSGNALTKRFSKK